MFTGIVEEIGTIREAGPRLALDAAHAADGSERGASLAVDGVCLTVVDRTRLGGRGGATLSFDLSPETLARSTLGGLRAGDRVNLERPVRADGRLGGHLVQGHVDGIGVIERVEPASTGSEIVIRVPGALERYVVEKGSITVSGVSLTVTRSEGSVFGVALVPYTLEATTLGDARPGTSVNLEVDVIARYVERLLEEAR